MIIDKRLQVSDNQAFTATAASTDVIDLGADRAIGPGKPMWLVAVAKVALAGTTPTLAISIETDDNADRSSATTIAETQTFTSFPAGSMAVVAVPFSNERYLAAKATLGGTTPTVTLDIWFTDQDPTHLRSYPDAL